MYSHEIGQSYKDAPHVEPLSVANETARGIDEDVLDDIGFRGIGDPAQFDSVLKQADFHIPTLSVARITHNALIQAKPEAKPFDEAEFDAAFDRYADHGMDSGTARRLALRDQGIH